MPTQSHAQKLQEQHDALVASLHAKETRLTVLINHVERSRIRKTDTENSMVQLMARRKEVEEQLGADLAMEIQRQKDAREKLATLQSVWDKTIKNTEINIAKEKDHLEVEFQDRLERARNELCDAEEEYKILTTAIPEAAASSRLALKRTKELRIIHELLSESLSMVREVSFAHPGTNPKSAPLRTLAQLARGVSDEDFFIQSLLS